MLTGDDVKAGREGDDVELALFAASDDALFGKSLDWCTILLVDVDDGNIIAVENFVVSLLKTWSLDAEWVWLLLWEKNLLLLGVLDTLRLSLAPEVVRLVVCPQSE